MNTAKLSAIESNPGLASWYTPGRSDGFGDRLLMFDNTDAVSLELLRFKRELAVTPGFDNALREGIERLSRFRHSAFAEIRAVVYLNDHDLTLVSVHMAGQRLSELPPEKLRKGLHPAIVTWIIREITPPLAALHSSGPAAAHGALSADRIVFTPEGRLCLVEHALGAALQRLGLSPAVIWREFGLLALADDRGVARIDARNDVVQLATVALSMLLGRAVTLTDFQRRLPALLDEFTAMSALNPSAFAAPLRVWLEHALQLSPHPYRSAADAQEGLKELPASSMSPSALAVATAGFLEAFPQEVARLEAARPLRPQHVVGGLARSRTFEALSDADRGITDSEADIASSTAGTLAGVSARFPRKNFFGAWIAIALGLVALTEAAVIARLAMQKPASAAEPAIVIESPVPGDTVMVDGRPVGTTPLQLTVSSRTRAIRLVHASTAPAVEGAVAPVPAATATDARAIAAIEEASARQRSGGVRISAPIELKVLEGDHVLGSTADGPIVASAGTHQLDLLNTALGYRVHQTVTIRAGALTALTITPPMGRISINADPWAQVLIDDKPIGDTPVANVSVTLGEHQVIFRHPQLGERRETVTVRADVPTRVSTSFR
jgi:PEGA domain-containing protein